MFLQINQVGETATAVAAEVVGGGEKLSLIDLATKGGWIMIVLAIMLIFCVYLFIERYRALDRALKDDVSFMNSIREYILSGNLDSARTLAKNNTTPISRMIEKGLSRLGRPLNDIQTAVENAGQLEVSRLERNLWLIATFAGLGPMLGFLGTVTGMVRAFFDMSQAGNNIDIQLLSGGIYEAMVTTVGGLIVGIIALFFYNLLTSKVDKIVFLLEVKATEFMDLLNEPSK